jgi:hypothetical protein
MHEGATTQQPWPVFGRARAPRAAKAAFVDQAQRLASRRLLLDEWLDVAWARTKGAEEDDLGGRVFGPRGDRDRALMDGQTDVTRARRWQG